MRFLIVTMGVDNCNMVKHPTMHADTTRNWFKKLVGSSLKSTVLVTMYVFNFNIYKPASIDIRKPYFLESSITKSS